MNKKVNKLKILRIKEGYGQKEFANLIGVSLSHYNQIENGKKDLIPPFVIKARDLLNCSLDDMVDQ